jgi:KaiC/GvpD/RAD55 family RecA-like ATPase/tetratricopeptide (TPR) repeat protein
LVKRLIEVTDTRSEYSHGRIAIEEAKVLDKQGDHIASSEKYDKAAAIFQKISLIETGEAAKEAKPLIYLCQAWQKMTMAEAESSPTMYKEAADLFRQANEHSSKESASLMALGHSSFCKALEAGTEFETTQTMATYEQATRHMDAAANYYLKAGFETTSDYAKATQRLFDAYVYMESAKRERDPAKEARFYSMAEKVLEVAAECFIKAGYQGKTEQVQRFLRKVKEKRELAVSLGEIFHAPAVTASTATFSTISSSEEMAVGLERFEHADIQAKLVQHETDIKVGDTATIEIQIVNVGKEPVSLIRIDDVVPAGFQLVDKPDYCMLENVHLTVRGKRLNPLKTEEIKIALRSFKQGSIEVKPRIVCGDWAGQQIVYSPEPVAFNISGVALPGRVSTGYADLDNLLFGGIPENYAVVLASPSSDERELLIKKFLEAGAKKGETTFYVTAELGNGTALAEKFPSSFYLFVCNPRADGTAESLRNVFKLKGVESLTDIDIALIKAFRGLDASYIGAKRACIEVVSDVLLQHHAVITRKWLSGVLSDLRAKGFTTLAVVNPDMHPAEEVQAILGLFEGEIRVSERETEKGIEKILRVRKLFNKRYLENELAITRERLES